MADIPFDHAGCNGWAVYSSKNIAAGNSKNIHIAEVRIEEDDKVMFISFCDSVGLTASAAINLFVKAVNREHRIPFEIKVEDPFFGRMTNIRDVVG